MIIAVIADIHANLPALRAVLKHARAAGAGPIWNVGDHLGYGPFPSEVVDAIQKKRFVNIPGNYDAKVLSVPDKGHRRKANRCKLRELAFSWAYENLTAAQRSYLQSLPATLRLTLGPWRVLLVHGSPASPNEHLSHDVPPDRLLELAALSAADLVICGHTHRPFLTQAGGTWFLNPGSVGRPDDRDPRSAYALLTLTPSGAISARFFRLPYDCQKTAAAVRKKGLPPEFAQMFLQGCALDDILDQQSLSEQAALLPPPPQSCPNPPLQGV